MHGRVGQHKARPAVRKQGIPDLHLVPQVELAVRVEVLQPSQQIRPDRVCVRLHEKIPSRLRSVLSRLLDHREELPLVQFPPGVICHSHWSVGDLDIVLVQKCGATAGSGAIVERKVFAGPQLVARIAEDVACAGSGDILLEVGHDQLVRDAAQRGAEVDGHFFLGLGNASLEHD